MKTMICNYDNCSCASSEIQDCSKCQNGITILVSILGGIVFAVIVTLLFINNFLAEPGLSAWVALIAALVYLLAAGAAAAVSEKAAKCISCSLASVLIGIFGTVFAGYLSIAATITAGDVFSTVIVALAAFFFAYMIISTLFLIKCIAKAE